MTKTTLLLLALAFAAPVAAQQYKWVDQDGKVRYGDTPPAGAKATRLKPPPGPAGSPASAPAAAGKKDQKALTPEQAFQKRQKDQQEAEQKAQKERAEAEVARTNCQSSQARLRQLQSGERVAITNAAGERVYLDDSQRTRDTELAQKAVSDWCK